MLTKVCIAELLSAVRLITLMHCYVLNVMVFANNTELFTVILSS